MKRLQLTSLFLIVSIRLFSQPPTIQWQKCLGGTSGEDGLDIIQLSNGDYLLVGETTSNDGDVSGNHSGNHLDAWLLKLDHSGSLAWQRCYGGSFDERGYSILPTGNGGFLCAAERNSNDGDLSGISSPGHCWIFKCDSLGNIIWQKCFGGSEADIPKQIINSYNGGYAFIATTFSNDYDVSGLHDSLFSYSSDAWVAKIDSVGNLEWAKCFGGSWSDEGHSIVLCPDSGYVVLITTPSYDGDINCNHSTYNDYWVGKIDKMGNLQWGKCYGGSDNDGTLFGATIINSFEGGYVFAGNTKSSDGDVSGNHGYEDFWVVKLDTSGNIQWQKCLGGSDVEFGAKINQLADSTYVIVGHTASEDGDITNLHGIQADYWVVNIDRIGNVIWQNCYGGTGNDKGFGLLINNNNNILLTGGTESNNGDVSGNHGGGDVWVVKLNPLPDAISEHRNSIINLTCYFTNSEELSFQFTSDYREQVIVNLFDITGRRIMQRSFAATKGYNKREILTDHLSRGIYMMRLETNRGSVVRKIVAQ